MWLFVWEVTIVQFTRDNWLHGRMYKKNSFKLPNWSSRDRTINEERKKKADTPFNSHIIDFRDSLWLQDICLRWINEKRPRISCVVLATNAHWTWSSPKQLLYTWVSTQTTPHQSFIKFKCCLDISVILIHVLGLRVNIPFPHNSNHVTIRLGSYNCATCHRQLITRENVQTE